MCVSRARRASGPRKSAGLSSTPSYLILLSTIVGSGACATTGSTLGSGVGDTLLEHPPFYAGADVSTPADGTLTGYLPVAYQRGASQPALFDPEATGAMASLLEEMTRYLEDLGAGVRLDVSAETHRGPDVRFGCVTESGDAEDDCADRGDGALGRGSQPMHLAVGRPSPEWTAWADAAMQEKGVEHALVLTVEVGQYWIRQRGLRGTKEVELGTNHVARFPWLTSLEGAVPVVQLTGALVGRDGKAVRIGVEGMLAKRTGMAASVLGAQTLVTEDDVRALLTERREDLPDRPLVWQAAVRSLVEQLTGRAAVVVRPS